MPSEFKDIDWNPLEEATSSKLNDMADNQRYLNRRKIEGGLRNLNPVGSPGQGQENLFDNLVLFADYRKFTPGENFPTKQTDKKVTPYFSKRIKFPQNFFSPVYLPIVVSSVGIVNSSLKKISHVINDVDYKGFTIIVREFASTNFTESMSFFCSYLAVGVKF